MKQKAKTEKLSWTAESVTENWLLNRMRISVEPNKDGEYALQARICYMWFDVRRGSLLECHRFKRAIVKKLMCEITKD